MSSEKIAVKNVSKKIGKKTILENISFNVHEGDICGFIGPNGAGKTTMIRVITNLISPTEGEVTIDGANVVKERKTALLKLGAIVEEPIFFPYMSGRKNLQNLAMLNPGMSKSEQKEKVEEVLKIVDLQDRGCDKVKTYSLGMKQRLGIAQALLNNPEVIILDEPANGLDPMGMRDLRELIFKLQKEKKITFFISSHLLDELQQLCNRFVVINKGKLVWQGSKDELESMGKSGRLEDAFIKLVSGC
ncbi:MULTISPECIES: ABC transporter ATP-binding protein [Clostridium]|uniref:ABC transporter ATP-binding protein YxlF n=2 Tax=Clostridium TaxID=1485 RepID=D8GM55_CLOLD|nr:MULTISPECIES: ATP-binding cassette domain-containing protein [Clostridium]ADK15629.1 predicted ABC transporter, ATPase component [Clostridium ljungdahlii DSM 13528]AGY74869.1 ATP-binding cassette domain-containing protein [Clostridium autoethanogenum DSM 10061]ALU35046.1 ABC-type transport system ATPase component [Clostridium autoethanogenum DSM 10061]OAA86512.1 putative ABC transporter ATP-binding protein YxlF [Clostridium ljungdahlii DSM 13528]OVY49455.1 putative ABC transporter ATP-bindi